MSASDVALAALVAATWLHAGFQLTVSVLVYPALLQADPSADPGAGRDTVWAARHDRHSRRITPVVGVVYGALVVAGVWVLVAGPRSVPVLVALASAAVAIAATAAVAAPAHGRLTAGRDPAVEHRLAVADLVRLAAAVLGAVAAALAVVTQR